MTEMQARANDRMGRAPTARRAKLLIGGTIVALTVVYLILTAARDTAAYYMTVGELLGQGPLERNVRVSGTIVDDSIVWQPRDLILEFEIADESGSLPVVYHGPRPEMFRAGAEVVIEGRHIQPSVFRAQKLLLKCPSKYEEANAGG